MCRTGILGCTSFPVQRLNGKKIETENPCHLWSDVPFLRNLGEDGEGPDRRNTPVVLFEQQCLTHCYSSRPVTAPNLTNIQKTIFVRPFSQTSNEVVSVYPLSRISPLPSHSGVSFIVILKLPKVSHFSSLDCPSFPTFDLRHDALQPPSSTFSFLDPTFSFKSEPNTSPFPSQSKTDTISFSHSFTLLTFSVSPTFGPTSQL